MKMSYKVTMKDTLNWMKDFNFRTFKESEVIDFIRKCGSKITLTVEELIESDLIEICLDDGIKLSIVND